MKKLLFSAIMMGMASLSALAQQQVLFSATGNPTTRLVWDDWSTVAPKPDASNNVAFLWALSGTPLVDTQTGLSQTATNGSSVYNVSMAWTDILTDPNYHFATNGASIVVTPTSAVGNYSYNSSTSFTLAGAPSSGNILIYVIAWPKFYSDPFSAAASGAVVGWSDPFSYAIGTPTSAAVLFSTATSLDNLRIGESVPEPAAFALIGMGSASLLIFRRRKQG